MRELRSNLSLTTKSMFLTPMSYCRVSESQPWLHFKNLLKNTDPKDQTLIILRILRNEQTDSDQRREGDGGKKGKALVKEHAAQGNGGGGAG